MLKVQKWRYKLPIIPTALYILISIPFIFGIRIPSVHEGNNYSVLYAAFHLIVAGNIINAVSHIFLKGKAILAPDIVYNAVFLLFIVVSAFIAGLLIDTIKHLRISKEI